MFSDWQMQQKAIKDAERKKKKEAAESLQKFRGVDKEQERLLEQRKAKKADAQSKKDAAEQLHNFKGETQELEFQKQQKEKKLKDKKGKKAAQENLKSHGLSPTPAKKGSSKKKSSDKIKAPDIAASSDEDCDIEGKPKKTKKKDKKSSKKTKSAASSDDELKEEEGNRSKSPVRRRKSKELEWMKTQNNKNSSSPKAEKDFIVGKSRKTIQLDFAFGIITGYDDDPPEMVHIESAAKEVVPKILEGSLKECNLRVDSKAPVASGDIEEDPWFESDDMIRWKIHGQVSVSLFVEKDDDIKETAAPIQKMLKRYTSWRQDPKGPQGQQWNRVREGRLALGITF